MVYLVDDFFFYLLGMLPYSVMYIDFYGMAKYNICQNIALHSSQCQNKNSRNQNETKRQLNEHAIQPPIQ